MTAFGRFFITLNKTVNKSPATLLKLAMPNIVESHLEIVKYVPEIFFTSILTFLLIGWLFGRFRTRTSEHVVVRDSLATAIFGLSALVLGFTFSNATDHYDKRISLIRDQAFSLKQVYQSSNYLNPTDRVAAQNILKQILARELLSMKI